jgi:omega-amidase
MKITIVQPDLIWEDKAANFSNLEALILPLFNKTDIIILPEMFNTGFSMNPENLCESPGSETFEWMQSISKKGNFGVCGSYIIKVDEDYFNRWVFVSPEEETWYYNKRHLFSPGGEEKTFSKGKNRLVFSFRGVRICPNICYDLRFPVWSRNRNDYDLLINSANWPKSRREVWITLLKARAIENQCFVAGSNRIGIDGKGVKYCGDSMIIGPMGDIKASSISKKQDTVTYELLLTELSDFRQNFPVQKDADNFSIDY